MPAVTPISALRRDTVPCGVRDLRRFRGSTASPAATLQRRALGLASALASGSRRASAARDRDDDQQDGRFHELTVR
jgi:hypothetical protein